MENLTQIEMEKVKGRCGKYRYQEQYCGFVYDVFIDTALELSNVYQIKNDAMLYCDKEQVKEILKKRFLQEKKHRTIYIIASVDHSSKLIDYEEAVKLGENWWGCDIYSAKWYNSKDDLFASLKDKSLCLNNTILLEYDIIYLQSIIENGKAQLTIRKI